MDRRIALGLALALLGVSPGVRAAPLRTRDLAEPDPLGTQLRSLQRRVRELEQVVQVAAPDPNEEAVGSEGVLDRIRMTRPVAAGPMRDRVALDLDQNRRFTDLGPRGSGEDGVLVLGVASLEETSPWEWLRAYDTNRDRKIDAEDYGFARMRVWIDADRDLIPRSRELHSPGQLGVRRIHLPHEPGGERGHWESQDGSTHLAGITEY